MPRPQRCRRICSEPMVSGFSPDNVGNQESVFLTMDEFEAIRLIDAEKQNQDRFKNILSKGEHIMRIAVTYENGEVFQHFGHTEQFKFYDVKDGKVISSQVADTNGSGHGALAGFLTANKVDALICGGIGGGAQAALAEAGIQLYGGVQGSADEAVNALLTNTLSFQPNVSCSHHDRQHGGEGHTCGEYGCH